MNGGKTSSFLTVLAGPGDQRYSRRRHHLAMVLLGVLSLAGFVVAVVGAASGSVELLLAGAVGTVGGVLLIWFGMRYGRRRIR